MKKTNLISLIVFVVALVWVFTLKNETVRNIQAKVLGVFGISHEAVASVSFDADLVNGEAISPEKIAERYEEEELAGRYNQLLKELFELRAWRGQIEILREENIELKRSLNFVDYSQAQQRTLIAARVTNRQSGSWWRTVTIDKGAKDGVIENSPIMTPVAVDRTDSVEGALVGKVTVVGENESTVVLATDEECHVAAYVHGVFAETSSGLQRVQGILSGAPGAGTNVPHLILRNLPKEADKFGVKTNAKVYSAGITTPESEGVFPPGLILGYIKEFEVNDIDAEARVTPAIDFNSLSYVFVLVPTPAIDSERAPRPDAVTPPATVVDPLAPPVTPAEDVVPRATPAEEVVPRAEPAAGGAPRAEPAIPTEPEVPRARAVDDDID